MVRILALASLTVDIINDKRVPGGPALYFFLASKLTKVELFCIGIKPKDYRWVRPFGFFVEDIGPVFKHVYRDDNRSSWIIAEPTIKNYYVDLLALSGFDGIIISPIFGDIPPRLIEKAYETSMIVAVDISGFIRSGRNKKIVYHKLLQAQKSLIEKADFIHISHEEISASGLLQAKKATLLTLGSKGCIIHSSKYTYYVPAYPVVGDATGAGDFFLFVFLVEWIKSRDLLGACVKANASASLLVEGMLRDTYKGIYDSISKILLDRERIIRQGIRRIR